MSQKNAIVIMLDTMQFNYLGCYGNDWIRTPNIDRLSREGVLFENAYTEGLPTVPCRRAMHTGRYTLPVKGWSPLDMDDTTIADLCWGRPIDTALIFDCPMYRLPKFGYTRGFDKVWFLHGHEGDHYYHSQDELIHYTAEDFHEDHILKDANATVGENVTGPLLHETASFLKNRQYWKTEEDQNVAKVMKSAVRYIEERDRNKSFYLWVDSFDPHEPWDPPSVYDPYMECPYNPGYKGKDQFLPIMGPVEGVYTDDELHHIRMLYAEKITMCDRWVGHLLDAVRNEGLETNTLVLLTSDHGEPLGKGEHGHGIMRKCRPWPYEELAHIPLIIRAPGLPHGKRCKGFAQSVDVAPTVCDWLGIGVHPKMQGKTLLPMAKGEVEKVRDFAIAGYHKYSWSLIGEKWSYIHWVKKDEGTLAESMFAIYGEESAKASAHLIKEGTDNQSTFSMETVNESQAMHKKAASLDGEDQWTCTPGSVVELPDSDELYDRATDQFQLNNVIKDNQEEARKILKTLRTYMEDLRNS